MSLGLKEHTLVCDAKPNVIQQRMAINESLKLELSVIAFLEGIE